jgi:IclR family acetate operon transcriptional repressor
MPAHVTSAGRSLLAELPVEEVRSRYGSDPLPPGTERAITSLAELEQVLDEVRASGYSTSFGESERDIGAVSVAIRDRGGRAVAAVSVSAPIDRLGPQRGEQIAQAAKRAAARIGAALA